MSTLARFRSGNVLVPASTSWYLADLGEFRGQQALFTRQSPQRLKTLREHALIESAVSSNRIEGVVVEARRVRELVLGRPLLRDRGEEEVRGYRDALKLIHEKGAKLPVSERTTRTLHRIARGDVWDSGRYKERDADIIERGADGSERVRFKPVSASATPAAMASLLGEWRDCRRERWIHPLIALAAFNLDFLCIHPFRDGNGRVSRLLLLLQSYHLGYEVGRYISLERLIEQNKERYYETLDQCSARWHTQKNDPWPFINHVLFVLKSAYREFVDRVGDMQAPRGSKTEQVLRSIRQLPAEFTLAQLEQACPGVSRDMVRRVLREQSGTLVSCRGRGPGARWAKLARKKR